MKIVLTGAAGRLGSYLREPLSKMAKKFISTDISDIGKLYENESFIQADLANFAEMGNGHQRCGILLYTLVPSSMKRF